MRFSSKSKKYGDTRVVIRFLFIPRCIKGEWRWMDMASIRQEMIKCVAGPPAGPAYDSYRWMNIEWEDK